MFPHQTHYKLMTIHSGLGNLQDIWNIVNPMDPMKKHIKTNKTALQELFLKDLR